MPALCSMLQHTYYAQNYAGIYNVPKPKQQPWWTMQPLTDHDPVLGSTVSYYLVQSMKKANHQSHLTPDHRY